MVGHAAAFTLGSLIVFPGLQNLQSFSMQPFLDQPLGNNGGECGRQDSSFSFRAKVRGGRMAGRSHRPCFSIINVN